MEIKPVISFDLDGTLVNASGAIHPRDVEILQTFREAWLIPATGRFLSPVHRVFERAGLLLDGRLPFPLVLQNGTALYRPGEALVEYFPFRPEVQRRLIEIGEGLSDPAILLSDDQRMVMLTETEFGTQAAREYELPFRPYDPAQPNRFCKMLCLSPRPAALRAVEDQLPGLDVVTAYSMSTIMEVTPGGTSKGRGLRLLLDHLGLDGAPVYAVGDGWNDLSLFAEADHSFTPSTSPAEIQARAGQVIDARPEGVLTPVLRAIGLLN